jgi:hypothetical protein
MFLVSTILTLCANNEAHADPIKLQPIAVTASATHSGFPPSNVIDGSSNTYWTAGGPPTQWIQLDLGRQTAVQRFDCRLSRVH